MMGVMGSASGEIYEMNVGTDYFWRRRGVAEASSGMGDVELCVQALENAITIIEKAMKGWHAV